jgi:hypothetical protein
MGEAIAAISKLAAVKTSSIPHSIPLFTPMRRTLKVSHHIWGRGWRHGLRINPRCLYESHHWVAQRVPHSSRS